MGRCALVTGGGTGIGRGVALALARRGGAVCLVGRRADRLAEAARGIEALGGRAHIMQADLSNPDELSGLVERAEAALGRLDLLVNNAGVLMGGNLLALSAEDVSRSIMTNLIAPIEITRQALPYLKEHRGTVVFIASTMSVVPMPFASLYAAGKSGIRAFAESMRYELEPVGVRLLVVYPPSTATSMTRGMREASGVRRFPARKPEAVGEEIVSAIIQGREELMFGADRTLITLYRVIPRLVRAALRSQRARFERMMHG